MNPLRLMLRRLGAPFRKRAMEADMAEEMRLHLSRRIEENLADGMSPDEARFAARRKFGGIEQAKEAARDARDWRWFEELRQDLRHARRTLAKSPTHAAVAILILALGIGATTALFNVAYAVLLNPFPYARPAEIWCPDVRSAQTGKNFGMLPRDHAAIIQLPGVASSMASTWTMGSLVAENRAEFVKIVHLSESAFDFLGVPALLGRGLGPGDVQPDGEPAPVTVLSHRLWRELFHGDPAVIGKKLKLNDRTLVVVGVAPPRFTWKTADGLWVPLSPTDSKIRWVNTSVRLAPGVSPAAFEREVSALCAQIARAEPQRFPDEGVRVRLLNYYDLNVAQGALSSSLRLLGFAVGFFLLIACANVANLQLARGAGRAREFAIRLSMGAGRPRLIRQLLAESLVLSLAGGFVGIGLAFGFTRLVVALIPPVSFPTEADVAMNAPVLAFSVGLSVLTGVLFGLAPALQCTRTAPAEALKDGDPANAGGEGRRQKRLRGALVVAEVALAVVLLVGASLAVRGFVKLESVDVGFRSEQTLFLTLHPASPATRSFADSNRLDRELLQRVSALPGVESVSIGMLPSVEGGTRFTLPGFPAVQRSVHANQVGANYRATLGIPLKAGRDLTGDDINHGAQVALINEAAAKLWPAGTDPIGQRIQLRIFTMLPPSVAKPRPENSELTIVGIVGDTRNMALRGPVAPTVFFPHTLLNLSHHALVVRTLGDPADLIEPIRAVVRAVDPALAIASPITGRQALGQQTVQPRFDMALFSGLAGLGLMLACAGIYSVLSYHVAQRTREFSVRLALGARPAELRRLMLGEGARLLAIGLGIGLACSLAVAPLVPGRVFLVPLLDPLALTTALAVLGTSAILACLVPAGQAMKVDPLVALRHN